MKSLDLNQMGLINGSSNPFTDPDACNELATGLGGAATIIGFSSWWTGAGAGIATVVGSASFFYGLYCQGLD